MTGFNPIHDKLDAAFQYMGGDKDAFAKDKAQRQEEENYKIKRDWKGKRITTFPPRYPHFSFFEGCDEDNGEWNGRQSQSTLVDNGEGSSRSQPGPLMSERALNLVPNAREQRPSFGTDGQLGDRSSGRFGNFGLPSDFMKKKIMEIQSRQNNSLNTPGPATSHNLHGSTNSAGSFADPRAVFREQFGGASNSNNPFSQNKPSSGPQHTNKPHGSHGHGSLMLPQSNINRAVKPPSHSHHKIGDMNRSFIEGMNTDNESTAGSLHTAKKNQPGKHNPARPFGHPPHPHGGTSNRAPHNSGPAVLPSELHRPVGDMTRTHLEGMASEGGSIANGMGRAPMGPGRFGHGDGGAAERRKRWNGRF